MTSDRGAAHLEGDVMEAVTLDAVGDALMSGGAAAASVGVPAGAGEEASSFVAGKSSGFPSVGAAGGRRLEVMSGSAFHSARP